MKKLRDEACEEYLGGILQTGKIEDLRMVCHSKSLAKAIKDHNEDPKNKHMDCHGVVCLSEKMIDGKDNLLATFFLLDFY